MKPLYLQVKTFDRVNHSIGETFYVELNLFSDGDISTVKGMIALLENVDYTSDNLYGSKVYFDVGWLHKDGEFIPRKVEGCSTTFKVDGSREETNYILTFENELAKHGLEHHYMGYAPK